MMILKRKRNIKKGVEMKLLDSGGDGDGDGDGKKSGNRDRWDGDKQG